ncbi:flagellar biosynthesis protein FlhF [Polaromonas sp.]|uniref:flagellar biosynthesis protein FlhF n=1 Tax=Polaromonas sp. TaxID=1869339 RepID=UPI0032662945
METNTDSCRVVAPSSREALRLVREKLGPEAIILSNRVTAEGVEIVAALERAITAMTAAATQEAAAIPVPAESPPAARLPAVPVAASDGDAVLREIHSMRGMIEEQLAGLAWNEAQRRDPVRGHLLRTLLGAGFSTRLARDLLASLPTGQNYANGLAYVKSALEGQLPLLENEDALMDEGGVYALMGPTGVGKTTTTAKLAARCVMRFGPEKLALVTTDSYRIGAYEQLRIYGQILGVSVHAVKDAVDLEGVLADLRDKHMVLIDTVGMSQRDRAVSDQIAMLCSASRPIRRLLLLNASSHGDTLNEVVQAYRHGQGVARAKDLVGCIFTKVDEATHPGVLLDMAIRHQLPVHYISSGQKVPEHLALCDRRLLVDSVFQAKSTSALFVPGEAHLDERPVALRNDQELLAAEAVSERLRSQCQQLIRALTHNAQELTSNAAALSAGRIGFDETRAFWQRLSDEHAGQAEIARDLQLQAGTDAAAACGRYVLLLAGETSLPGKKNAESSVHRSAVLLSDRTGLPFAAVHEVPANPALAGSLAQHRFSKPIVHLLACTPEPGLISEWQNAGLHWAACTTATLRVTADGSGTAGTLAKLAAVVPFSTAQPFLFRGKAALLSVADVMVKLRAGARNGASGSGPDNTAPLRCVIRRVVDAASGKPLAHSYLLASAGVRATALQMAQWPGWRLAAEPHFKLLGQTLAQLADAGTAGGEAAGLKRLLVGGQVCTTVLRLQRAPQAWAETARQVLTQLAGHAGRAGRPVSGPVLLEGLAKFFVLLDALETDAAAASSRPHVAAAQG